MFAASTLFLLLRAPVAWAGVGETQVTTHGGDARPAWSGSGTEIAFDSDRSGNEDVWRVSASGGSATQLTVSSFVDQHPDWSPDASQIVYVGPQTGAGFNDLWLIPANGGTPALLHADSTTAAKFPSWSPDGTEIAFELDNSIYVIPAGGGTPVLVTTNATHPSWSPDGTEIAFLSNQSGNNDIWTIPAGGGTATQITTDPGNDGAPDWSPDGTQIAFQSNRSGNNDIWVIPAAGGTATQITTHAAPDNQPDWSPDGTEIAFSRGGAGIWVSTLTPPVGVDLAVTKSVDDPTPDEGGTIAYTIVVTNLGPSPASNVELTDALPTGVTFVTSSASQGSYSSGTGAWTVGTVGIAVSDTLTITATVDPGTGGTVIVNSAAVTAVDETDLDGGNDSDSASITVQTVVRARIFSAANQSFLVGDPEPHIRPIQVLEDSVGTSITAGNDIRIRIPPGFSPTWDPATTIATLSGSAAGKVSSTVTFEDAGKTLVVDVTADFAPGDDLTLSDLDLTDLTTTATGGHLELEVGNDDVVTHADEKLLHVLPQISSRSTAIDITPDGEELWVVNPDHGTVAVIATQGPSENTLLAEIPVGREPWALDMHPTNGEVWVTSKRDDHVYVIDAATRTVVDSIAAGFETFGVAIDPRGSIAVVSATGSDQLFGIDVETRTVTDSSGVYRRPRGVTWKPDGTEAWTIHLMMPEFAGRVTKLTFPWLVQNLFVGQVFHATLGGYPSTMQNITLAPAPGDSILWIPSTMINTGAGQLSANPLSAVNMFHSIIRPLNVSTGADLSLDTYYLSESGTPVGGPIAVDFKSGHAYVANLNSENVTVLTQDILDNPTEVAVIPAGKAPIGIVTHPTLDRAYVANWLSRDVTVIDTQTNGVVATVPTATSEPLPAQVLNGKQFFYTSTGVMSFDGRGACASCHIFGTHDARPWDLSQYGKHNRATPDVRGIGFTGGHNWNAGADEMADHAFGILEFTFGTGLIPTPNPPLGAPNGGLSQDMDDIGRYMTLLTHRPDTPFLNPDGTQTAEADSGEVLFFDATVGCADCHVPPFFTDSQLPMPFVKHDVGTAVPGDTDGAGGFDTPSLIGLWDTGPYLHHSLAKTLDEVLTTYNENDEHGTTSQLSAQQRGWLIAYLNSIAWPDSTGTPVDAPVIAPAYVTSLDTVFPNPFAATTSLRFTLERQASHVEIVIFDIRGRRVRSLLDRRMTQGTHLAGWDSRDDRGKRVGAGIYFARLVVDREQKGVKRMTVLR